MNQLTILVWVAGNLQVMYEECTESDTELTEITQFVWWHGWHQKNQAFSCELVSHGMAWVVNRVMCVFLKHPALLELALKRELAYPAPVNIWMSLQMLSGLLRYRYSVGKKLCYSAAQSSRMLCLQYSICEFHRKCRITGLEYLHNKHSSFTF